MSQSSDNERDIQYVDKDIDQNCGCVSDFFREPDVTSGVPFRAASELASKIDNKESFEDSTCAAEAGTLAGFPHAPLFMDGYIRQQAFFHNEAMMAMSLKNSLDWSVVDDGIEGRAKAFIDGLQNSIMALPVMYWESYWEVIRTEHKKKQNECSGLLNLVAERIESLRGSSKPSSPMKITDVNCEAMAGIGAPPGLQLPSQMGPIMIEPMPTMDATPLKQGSPVVVAPSEKNKGEPRTQSLVELDAVGGWDFENLGDSQNKFTFPVRASQFKTTNRTLTLDRFEARIGDRMVPFQLHITAEHVSEKRHGWSFKKALGSGKIDVKCREEHPPECDVAIMFFIARGVSPGQRPRPVTHNFSERPTAALPQQQDLWDFLGAQDRNGQVLVSVELKEAGV